MDKASTALGWYFLQDVREESDYGATQRYYGPQV